MTPLQKGFFIAETAEYAEQYLFMEISALSAFSAMSFCSELNYSGFLTPPPPPAAAAAKPLGVG
jgi:hypothetical protein